MIVGGEEADVVTFTATKKSKESINKEKRPLEFLREEETITFSDKDLGFICFY